MGYAALLFCFDEKTARTVTQVLSELDFAVEACTEPFAAVKKLMSQHFDAVVVDCDHEQNATLVFKSARNSTPNQASLAVAVVEGQAGVAKAFRIGANLVLTKPINIEQAKGTLRVARGLLRKSDPVKPGIDAPGAAVPDSASKPASPKPVSATKLPATASAAAFPVSRSVAALSSLKPAPDDDLLGIDDDPSPARPAAVTASQGIAGATRLSPVEAKPPIHTSSQRLSSSGAASAPAPAREPEKPGRDSIEIAVPEKAAESTVHPAGIVGSVPTFGYGGASTSSGGSAKKIAIALVAAVILAGAAYAGWTHFHGTADQVASTSTDAAPSSALQTESAPARPAEKKPSAINTESSLHPSASVPPESKNHKQESLAEEADAAKPAPGKPGTAAKSDDENSVDQKPETPAEEPLVVKGGKISAKHKASVTEDDAPSMIGLAAPGASTPPPNFVPTDEAGLKPTLQTLHISQGVSQGLLIKKVAPVYPGNAIRMRIEGAVELMATVSKTGAITHIKVVSGNDQLAKAAVEAVKQWKYRPYLLNGEPVEIQTQITINFKLPS